ncbi:MAG TPA: FAD-dependent oxidoreductase, partial [Bacillus sp. (in: firmicutes)]
QKAKTEEQVERLTKCFLDKLNLVLPGSERNWNGLSTVEHWLSYPWTKGSYSYFKVGQYTKLAGIAEEREGNIFFAGEHTSVDYQGCLNGAVASGERAAQEVMNNLIEEK